MGVVYLARQVRLNRLVALKMILSGDHANEETKLRFLAEAEAIAKLNHPGIVQVHEFGTHDNNPYFALEYISGGSLDKKLAGNPLPPKEAADLVEKLARAVQSAHDAGIIHRDLKPANILLDSPLPSAGEGSGVRGSVGFAPKITDFGLVKNIGSNMTATGEFRGSPNYMDPEQAEGKKSVGPAADIYALGAILYECLTGRAPFKAATPLDTLLQVINDEPVSVRQLQAKTPMDLETICQKCLQKEPGKRYGSAAELGEDLGRYLRHEPIIARRIGRIERSMRWCKRYPAVAALLLISVLGAVAALITSVYISNINGDLIQRAKETRREVERFHVANGLRLMETGDFFGAMLWFANPLMANPTSDSMESHQYRLGMYWRHERHPILLQQYFHEAAYGFTTSDYVNHVAFSPDGKRIVTAGGNGSAQVWDVQSGKPTCPPLIDDSLDKFGSISNAVFSNDGRKIVTTRSHNARVWDAITGKPLTPQLKHQGSVEYAVFSPDSQYVVTTSMGKTARIWNATTGVAVAPPLEHDGTVHHASFSPDGMRVVTASSDKTAKVWNATNGQLITTFAKHKDTVWQATFSCDGRLIVTASVDHTARLWYSDTGQMASTFHHRDRVRTALFSPDGSKVVTASYDNSARVWDAANGQAISIPMKHANFVVHASFSPDGRYIMTASNDKTVRLWNAATGEAESVLLPHQNMVSCAVFSPDGRRVATTGSDRMARVWDFASGNAHSLNLTHTDTVKKAMFSPDGSLVATASWGRTAQLWDSSTGHKVCEPLSHTDQVNDVSFSHDSRHVVTASQDRTVKLWSAPDGRLIGTPLVHKYPVANASFSPDNNQVLTAGSDGTYGAALLWDVKSLKVATLPMVDRSMQYASLSQNGKIVLTWNLLNTSQLWDAGTGTDLTAPLAKTRPFLLCSSPFSPDGSKIVTLFDRRQVQIVDVMNRHRTPLQYDNSIYSAEYSTDGHRIVTASDGNTANVWDATTGKSISSPLQHLATVSYANFSPNGQHVVTISGCAAFIWDWVAGQPVSPPLMHRYSLASAAFSSSGNRMVTTEDDSAHIWNTSSDNRLASDWCKIAKLIYTYEIDERGNLLRLPTDQLQSLFQELRSKYPADFSVTPQQARTWREDQIAQCMKEGNLPAACFHRDWLIAEMVQEAAKSRK